VLIETEDVYGSKKALTYTHQAIKEFVISEDTFLSIVIVNYKAKEYLRACLRSIFREQDVAYEVIVVDNASGDGSVEMVEEDFPSVHLIKNESNAGFAKANNIGIGSSVGKYILLLNPDAELTRSTLKILVSVMEQSPDVSAAGCKILYPDSTIQLSCGRLPTVSSAFWGGETINKLYRRIFPKSNFLGACGLTPESLDTRKEVETLLGACVILRKKLLEKVGLFDENFYLYFEENDFFYRVREAGGKVIYTPETTIIHHTGGSTKSLSKGVEYYHKSQEYYLRKHNLLKGMGWFRIIVMASAMVKSALLFLLYPFCRNKKGQDLKRKIAWHWYTFSYYINTLIKSSGFFRDEG
jgi:GT2 family glycosyltransferase